MNEFITSPEVFATADKSLPHIDYTDVPIGRHEVNRLLKPGPPIERHNGCGVTTTAVMILNEQVRQSGTILRGDTAISFTHDACIALSAAMTLLLSQIKDKLTELNKDPTMPITADLLRVGIRQLCDENPAFRRVVASPGQRRVEMTK